MDQNNLDNYLNILKNDTIELKKIDFKTEILIQNTSKQYITPKISYITAATLLALVSLLSIYNVNSHQQNLALENLKQERYDVLDSEYLYSTIVSSYKGLSGE